MGALSGPESTRVLYPTSFVSSLYLPAAHLVALLVDLIPLLIALLLQLGLPLLSNLLLMLTPHSRDHLRKEVKKPKRVWDSNKGSHLILREDLRIVDVISMAARVLVGRVSGWNYSTLQLRVWVSEIWGQIM